MKQKLTDMLFNLDKLDNTEVNELQDYFMKFARDCGNCHDCELRYHIVQVYQLHKQQHKHNRRNNTVDNYAEQFVHKHYDDNLGDC